MSENVYPVSVVNHSMRLYSKILVKLPACLAQLFLQKRSVDLGFKLFPLPYCLKHDHEFVFVFFLPLLVIALRIQTITLLPENLSALLLRVIFFVGFDLFSLLKGLFGASLAKHLLLGHISFAFPISIALHNLVKHLPDYLAILSASCHPAPLQHPLLLFLYFLCVLEPTLSLQHFNQVVPLLVQLTMLAPPTQLIQVALQMRLDPSEPLGLLSQFHKHQF